MIDHESLIRLISFLSILLLMLGLQSWWPRRTMQQGIRRWPANLGVVVIDTLVLRVLYFLFQFLAIPAGAMAVALWAEQSGIGLLNQLDLSEVIAVIIAVILLDFVIYWQHVLFHRWPLLWRLHRVHHSDRDFDVTTALRFHPLEIVLSMLIKMTAVVLLGIPVMAVLLFEIILNSMAMFNHANFHLPQAMDRWLRFLFVTPDVHRVHHSTDRQEHDQNFGFNLIIWDRLFGSYQAQPRVEHEKMQIGLANWQQAPTQSLWWLLKAPFCK